MTTVYDQHPAHDDLQGDSMTSAPDVDDAMSAVLDAGDPADQSSNIAAPGQGPCSEAEAHQLVERAINAAETFYDTIVEIIRRKAWVPLGYADPREMMLRSLGGTTNPASGKPYSRSHVHRMARVSWMLWAISDRTGVDAGELVVPERSLRELGGGRDADLALVDSIGDRVAAAINDKDASPDDVQDVIDSALSEATASSNSPSTSGGGSAETFDSEDVDGPSNSGPAPSGRGGANQPEEDGWDDPDSVDDESAPQRTPESPAMDAFGSGGGDEGFDAHVPKVQSSDMMAAVRAEANFSQTLADITEIGARLPDIIAVREKLPQFLDVLDDDELEDFKDRLMKTSDFITTAQEARETIGEVAAVADDRIDFM